jgi:beta-lactamase class C
MKETYPIIPFVADFEKFVYETMAETHLPGAAIAVVWNHKVVLLKGYGVKTFGTTDSVDIHSIFRVASVSKGFASMLAGILVQEKLINWDDKVKKYLPQFSLKDTESTNLLTIRHILSHTSGLPLHTFTNMIEQGIPYETLRDKLSTINVSDKPGAVFAYQNIVYSLISDIVKAATSKTYEELLHEKIFTPLGMTDASASYKDIMAAGNIAFPHFRQGETSFKVIRNTPEYYSVLPAAGVNASISDMSKWLLALLDNREDVISVATLNEIYKPEIVTPRRRKYEFFRWPQLRRAYYGLGWRVLNYGGNTLVYHGGHVNGYRAEVAFCPAKKIGIVIMTNATGKLANDGVQVFFDKFFDYKGPGN